MDVRQQCVLTQNKVGGLPRDIFYLIIYFKSSLVWVKLHNYNFISIVQPQVFFIRSPLT